MNYDLTFRVATATDAAALTSLAFRSKAHWGYSLEFMAACRDELTYTGVMIEAPQNHFCVGEIDDEIVGFYALMEMDGETAELEALFVLPGRIGTGIGKEMIEHCKILATQLGMQEIVIQGDPNADAFYLSAGGRPCGYRESGSIRGRQLPVYTIKL